MARFRLSWGFPEDGGAVLTFDKSSWDVFEAVAKSKELDAEEMISVAVAELVGGVSTYKVSVRQ